jgi:protocatechuate 3,4-dioxygenase beta subunit
MDLRAVPSSLMDQRRRLLLQAGLAVPALAIPCRSGFSRDRSAPTPSCGGETPSETAGPFYTANTPQKADFRADDPAGSRVDLRATVLDTHCRPLPGAVVDLWHSDSKGRYDNAGFRLRGHQRADAQGNVTFATVLPGHYAGRTRHFHARIYGAKGGKLLTTQLYFPDDPANADDWLFKPELLLDVTRRGPALAARFSFVVEV